MLWLYKKLVDLYNSLYDRGTFKSCDLGAKTISIGNLTFGGTGKTPLVAYIAKILAENGERVCVLTRGYKRKTTGRVLVSDGQRVLVDPLQGGDEPVELGRRLIGKAVIIADANRVSAAAWAKEQFDATVFLLDDGFQHRKAKRDLDIVCVDATNPFGAGQSLKEGRTREPFQNIARAHAVVITRADLVDSVNAIRTRIRKQSDVPVYTSRSEIVSLTQLREFDAVSKNYPTDSPDAHRREHAAADQ